MSYTWKALYPNDESSTTVLVYDDSGKQRINRHVALTKDEFSDLHIDAKSERTLNSIMAKELAREKREIEEAEKKADERSALRRSEFASAKVNWPGKTIWNHKVSVYMHSDGRFCDKSFGCSKSPHSGIFVNVCAPSDATPKDLKKIVVERHNKMMDKGTVPPYVPKEFAAARSSSGSDSDGGSRRGYRSRRRGRKLRKQTRKH